MKIHATRVSAPTPEQQHGTKWQVVITDDEGNAETYDTVRILGDCTFRSLPDTADTPHVFCEPGENATVIGGRSKNGNEVGFLIQRGKDA